MEDTFRELEEYQELTDRAREILDEVFLSDEMNNYEELDLVIYFFVEHEGVDLLDTIDKIMMTEVHKPLPERVVEVVAFTYEFAVEHGSAMAANNLGSLYYTGRAGRIDYEKAVKYYTIADKAGYYMASENLGYCYYYGFGIGQDFEKAYYYFSKAALADRYEAMYKLGDMFRNGFYVSKDPELTARCYIRSYEMAKAIEGEGEGTVFYGSLYWRLAELQFYGIATPVDLQQALRFYSLAEQELYKDIEAGDIYHHQILEDAIEKQANIREAMLGRMKKYKQ